MKQTGLKIRRFDQMWALCDGKPPVGCAPESGEIYIGTVIAWYSTFEQAKKMRSLVDSMYGYNREESEKGPKTPIFKFIFYYRRNPENASHKEYDGAVFTAPDENTAWKTFLGCDGNFKNPDSNNYNVENLGFAYLFNGTAEQWEQAVKDGRVE